MEYLVYDPEKNSLKELTEAENNLIQELHFVPPFKYSSIINRYVNEATDRLLFLKRVEEIFTIYYNWGAHNPHSFSSKLGEVQLILKEVSTLKDNLMGIKQPGTENYQITLSKKKGVKINFIRVFNVLYELQYFQNTNGLHVTKRDFMEKLGEMFSIDLSTYETDLSQAFANSPESNVAIFETMKKKIQEIHFKKLE